MDMSLSKLEIVKNREAWHAAVYRVARSQTGLSDWTTINNLRPKKKKSQQKQKQKYQKLPVDGANNTN